MADVIVFNIEYQIFICKQHQYAIINPATHLYEEHKDLSKAERKSIDDQHKDEKAGAWSDLRTPPPHSPPIDHLKPPIVAFLCSIVHCGLVSSSHKKIATHCRQHHGWRKTAETPEFWSHIWAQTWTSMANRVKYFQVRMPINTPDAASMVGPSSVRSSRRNLHQRQVTSNTPREIPLPTAAAQADLVELVKDAKAIDAGYEEEMEKLEAEMLKQDHTGWWSRTAWQTHFQGRNLKWIAHTSRLPDRDETLLVAMVELFNRFAQEALEGIRTLPQDLRRWLRSEQQYETSPRPFGRLQNVDSEDRYLSYIRRFLCYSARVWWDSGVGAPDWDEALGISPSNYTNGVRLNLHYISVSSRTHLQTVDVPPLDVSTANTSTANVSTANVSTANVSTANVSTANVSTANVSTTPLRSHQHPRTQRDDDTTNDDDSTYDDEDESEDDEDDDDHDTNNDTRSPALRNTTATQVYEEVDETKDARELFPWSAEASYTMLNLCRILQEDCDADVTIKMKQLKRFLMACIFRPISGGVFNSPLIHFTAVLGIDEENRRLKEAGNFSYILAGLVWNVRVIGAEILLPAARREDQLIDPSWRQRFLLYRRDYLADGGNEGGDTPMSELINLLAYGKYVALQTSNAGAVFWSDDKQTMFYRGIPIPLPSFRQMVQDNITRAESLFWEKLMWTRDEALRFTIDLDTIQDDQTFSLRGYSFTKQVRNGLQDGRTWMFQQMLQQRGKFRLRGSDHTWKLRNVRRWLAWCTDFLEALLFAVHSTYGSLARGTELTAIRHRNGAMQDRNHFLIDGSSSIIIRYHKSQALFDTPKIIPRFLPWRVGQLMVLYLVYVQPFREHLLVHTQNQSPSDHIWYNAQGPWETAHLTRVIKRQTALGLGQRFHTLDFRHIVISIGREVVGEKFAVGYKEQLGEVEEPEKELEDPIEVQSGRGEAMGAARYGVRADIIKHLTPKLIESLRPMSTGWHQFLRLASRASKLPPTAPTPAPSSAVVTTPAPPPSLHGKRAVRESWEMPTPQLPQWRSLFSTAEDAHQTSPTQTPSSSAPVHVPFTRAQIQQGLRQLFGPQCTGFRSPEQEEASLAVLSGESPVVVVLPTGGGKTVLAMLSIILESDGITIFIAPFRALVDDMVARFTAVGIPCFEWKVGDANPARLVVVSADIAVTESFLSYARLLKERQALRRIFVDEGHCTFEDSHWRQALSQLCRVRALGVPTYILTATLPPSRVHELEASMLVSNARIIRGSTIRPRHRYLVQYCRADELEGTAMDLCRRQLFRLQRQNQRGVVYSLSRTYCEELATELGCHHYHAHVHDRAERLEHWVDHGGLIVATSALGTGVDIAGITWILHVDIPFSMIDFAQQSGRGGRGGEIVDSIILVPQQKAEKRLQAGKLTGEQLAITEFVATTACRRLVMSRYLDGADMVRSCSHDAQWLRCDRCGEGSHEGMRQTHDEEEMQQLVERAMTEMTIGCVHCWMHQVEPDAIHSTDQCDRPRASVATVDQFRARIRYAPDTHSCHRCGVSQFLCATQVHTAQSCQWPGVMAPLLYDLFSSTHGPQLVSRAGYRGAPDDWDSYTPESHCHRK